MSGAMKAGRFPYTLQKLENDNANVREEFGSSLVKRVNLFCKPPVEPDRRTQGPADEKYIN